MSAVVIPYVFGMKGGTLIGAAELLAAPRHIFPMSLFFVGLG
jgi:hypothetical protein